MSGNRPQRLSYFALLDGHVCFACWMTKATDTHSEYVILITFHGSSGYANAPHCCIAFFVNSVLLCSFFFCVFSVKI